MFKQCGRAALGSLLLVAGLVALPMLGGATSARSPLPDASVKQLMAKNLIDGPNKEIVMLAVTYPAAGESLPHRHDAQVLVYVLEGEVRMQVRGGPAVTLRPGQSFYEAPNDVHVISANTSRTAPAKILVVMIKDKGTPGSRAITD